LVRHELQRQLGGYIESAALTADIDRYVTSPRLGDRSGVLGALVLAEGARRLADGDTPSSRPERD
jgi:fructokinase